MLKRLRFSLLSLLVGVVLAGGVVWLNMQVSSLRTELLPMGQWEKALISYEVRSLGFPLAACKTFRPALGEPSSLPLSEEESATRKQAREAFSRDSEWHYRGLVANIAIGLAIVFGGAGVCEYVVRRRAARAEKP